MRDLLILCLLISSLTTFGLALLAIRKRSTNGAMAYFGLMACITIYSGSYAYELSNNTLEGILLAIKIEYIAIPFLNVFWLALALRYTNSDGGKASYVLLASIIPIIGSILFYTNDYHHLYHTSITLDTDGPFPIASIVKGPMHHIFFWYSNILYIISQITLFRMIFKTRGHSQRQAIIMFSGSLLPFVSGYINQMGLSPYGIDVFPFGLAVAGPVFAIALFRFKMFDITPIARSTVFEKMKDPVLVIDEQNRVADYNKAAGYFFPKLSQEAIGIPVAEYLENQTEIMKLINDKVEGISELTLLSGQQTLVFNCHISNILNSSEKKIGRIIGLTDITNERAMQERLSILATTDTLTGLLNRRSFLDLAKREILKSLRYHHVCCCLLIDIDFFKKINDTMGHPAGDYVLQSVSKIFYPLLRQTDILCRWGGEEFVILLPETNKADALVVANRLRTFMENFEMFFDSYTFHVTISIGVSYFDPDQDKNKIEPQQILETLIARADQCLYQAKNEGRNRVASVQ